MAPGMRTSVAVRCTSQGTYYLQTWGDNTESERRRMISRRFPQSTGLLPPQRITC